MRSAAGTSRRKARLKSASATGGDEAGETEGAKPDPDRNGGVAAVAHAAPAGLDQTGKPDLKSTGPLAFGPKGVLFVGDPQGAQIFAIDVGTAPSNPIGPTFKLEGADAKIAALLGTKADDITINDVIIEPGTNIAYVSVSRGKGPTAEPARVSAPDRRPGTTEAGQPFQRSRKSGS